MATIQEHLADFHLNLNRLTDIVDEVNRHIQNDDLHGAIFVLATQQGKVTRFTDSWGGLQSALGDAGADPDKAGQGPPPGDNGSS